MALRKYRKALRYLDICWEKEGVDEEKNSCLRKLKSQIFTKSLTNLEPDHIGEREGEMDR
ncbi:hypothetical protein I3760_14G089200 [Carya illinoinensis]|nr:hypothetical protein I3760_14G089200 [Carya illinoinensis]